MTNTGKKLSEIITTKIMGVNGSDFLLGKYKDEDVKGAIDILKKYQKLNFEFIEQEKANKEADKDMKKTIKEFDKMNKENQERFIREKMKEFGIVS